MDNPTMKITATLIPHNMLNPVHTTEFDTENPDVWPSMIGLNDDGDMLDFITYRQHGVQFMLDDIGAIRDDAEEHVNLRAMMLDGKLRYPDEPNQIRLTHMLYGDILVLGLDAEGEAQNTPLAITELLPEIHEDATVFNRQLMEAQKRLANLGIIDAIIETEVGEDDPRL